MTNESEDDESQKNQTERIKRINEKRKKRKGVEEERQNAWGLSETSPASKAPPPRIELQPAFVHCAVELLNTGSLPNGTEQMECT